jgi:hypothetical protein
MVYVHSVKKRKNQLHTSFYIVNLAGEFGWM